MTCGARAAKTTWQFEPKGTQKLVQVAVGSQKYVWGRDSSGRVYAWNGTKWEQKTDKTFRYVTVSPNGQVYGLSLEGKIFSFDSGQWQSLGVLLGLKNIFAASYYRILGVISDKPGAGVVVNLARDGRHWVPFKYTGEKMNKVVARGIGKPWGVLGSYIYRYKGRSGRFSAFWARRRPGRPLKDIAIGQPGHLWGIDNKGAIYKVEEGLFGLLKWTNCSPPGDSNFISISVTPDDKDVWVVHHNRTVGKLVKK